MEGVTLQQLGYTGFQSDLLLLSSPLPLLVDSFSQSSGPGLVLVQLPPPSSGCAFAGTSLAPRTSTARNVFVHQH